MKEQEFNIGDIVKVADQEKSLYIITDVLEYEIGDSVDYDYELILIYPQRNTSFITLEQDRIKIHAKKTDVNNGLILEYLRKERNKKGLLGKPEYLEIIEENSKDKIFKTPLDTVRYDNLETIDKCLEAIRDLGILYEMFGDEAYLQLKEVVGKRIIELM